MNADEKHERSASTSVAKGLLMRLTLYVLQGSNGHKPVATQTWQSLFMKLALIIPQFRKKLCWDGSGDYDYMDERLHLFATMMALYPFTETKELVKEFLISRQEVIQFAWLYGIKKSKHHRRRVCIKNGRSVFLRRLWAARRKNGTIRYYTRNYERRRDNEQPDAGDNATR